MSSCRRPRRWTRTKTFSTFSCDRCLSAPAATQLPPPPRPECAPIPRAQREQAETDNLASGQTVRSDPAQSLPPMLKRRYRVYFTPETKREVLKLREVRAAQIGKIVTVKARPLAAPRPAPACGRRRRAPSLPAPRGAPPPGGPQGIVTRVGDVKPLMEVACYTCDDCGFEIYQEVNAESFMPMMQCPTSAVKSNGLSAQLHLQTRACKFSKFQEVKIQEMSEDVPIGHIPRTMTVQARGAAGIRARTARASAWGERPPPSLAAAFPQVKGELVRSMSPGDMVEITGLFLPKPYTGFRAMRAGLARAVHPPRPALPSPAAAAAQRRGPPPSDR